MVIALIVGAVFLFYLFLRWNEHRNREAFSARNVPYVPLSNAILSVLRKERIELTKEDIIRSKGFKVFGFNQMNRHTILVTDPEIAKQVFSKEFTSFTNRRDFQIKDPILSNVITNVMDDQWKRLRSIITPSFSSGSLRRMKPRIDETVRDLLRNFNDTVQKADNKEIDVKRLFGAFTMDTIIQVAFGTKVDSIADPNNPIILHARKVFSKDLTVKDFTKILTVFLLPRIATLLNIRIQGEALEFFQEFSHGLIRKKKAELKLKENFGKASSFLELILEAEAEQKRLDGKENQLQEETVRKGGKFMSPNEMIAQCVIFFLAGYDTTATTITLASYLLALHPEAQEKLYQEIVEVTEKLGNECTHPVKDPVELITFDTLPKFEYLNAVVSETLRLHSPALATERVASRNISFQSEGDGSIRVDLLKGDVVQFPIYSMHRDPEQFPEPESFRPERFLGEPTFHKYSYLPFGAGPRNCVAKSLALLEVKLALLHIVRRYRLMRGKQTKVPFEVYYHNNLVAPRDVILMVQKRD